MSTTKKTPTTTRTLAALALLLLVTACRTRPTPPPPAPAPEPPHVVGASVGPTGTGVQCFLNGSGTSPAVNGVFPQALVGSTDGGLCPSFVQLTQDDILPGLSVSISGSGNGTFEAGQTWTTTGITASPACNAVGVTHCVLSDTLANSDNDLGVANPLSAPLSTYAESTNGSTVGITLNLTQNSVNKNSNTLTSTWWFRSYSGVNASASCTSSTASGNNAALVGCSGTLTGSSPANVGVGTTFTLTPSGSEYAYFQCVHTASAHTFHDQSGFTFPLTVINTFSFTDQYGAAASFDLYQNSNPITQSYTITVESSAWRIQSLARRRQAARAGRAEPEKEAA